MKLDSLLRKRVDVWRGGDLSPSPPDCIPTGFAELDRVLAGGWPQSGLVDILCDHAGVLELVVPAMAELSREDRWLAWVAPPYIPYAPALAFRHIDLARVLLIRPRDEKSELWTLEQTLRSGACSAVLAWTAGLDVAALRRLQLAATAGNALAVLFRPASLSHQSVPAALRLQAQPVGDGWNLEILKRRGGWPSGPHHLNLTEPLVHHEVVAPIHNSFVSG